MLMSMDMKFLMKIFNANYVKIRHFHGIAGIVLHTSKHGYICQTQTTSRWLGHYILHVHDIHTEDIFYSR